MSLKRTVILLFILAFPSITFAQKKSDNEKHCTASKLFEWLQDKGIRDRWSQPLRDAVTKKHGKPKPGGDFRVDLAMRHIDDWVQLYAANLAPREVFPNYADRLFNPSGDSLLQNMSRVTASMYLEVKTIERDFDDKDIQAVKDNIKQALKTKFTNPTSGNRDFATETLAYVAQDLARMEVFASKYERVDFDHWHRYVKSYYKKLHIDPKTKLPHPNFFNEVEAFFKEAKMTKYAEAAMEKIEEEILAGKRK